jgi:hypothetical protein
MKRLNTLLLAGVICLGLYTSGSSAQTEYRHISADEYVDKVKAGWIGQMAGVGWGWPTEFRFKGIMVPEEKVPEWKPQTINQFKQDDLYVEMTFLRTLELYGLDVSSEQAGIDFANSSYPLFHANNAGRATLRNGIAPPDSGHPEYNDHADDIDYQIEADFSGLIAPGLPNAVIELGEKFGRIINYGDGLYGGQFVGGMYAEAFFETDMEKVIEAGLRCIPPQSQYYECITDTVQWYHRYPNDWMKTWQLVLEKYHKDMNYRKSSCVKGDFNIDAKINGAYIVMGLLYGEGDIDKTIVISMRCGQDSDCNPSSAAGILCTSIGFSKLPEKYTSALKYDVDFTTTSYNFVELIHVCETLARQGIMKAGGQFNINSSGDEVFVIPVKKPQPSKFVQCFQPGPVANSRFTEEQMAQMNGCTAKHLYTGFKKFAPGWKISKCGDSSGIWPGFHENEKKPSFVTCPLGDSIGCVLSKNIKVPVGKKSMLKLAVGHDVRAFSPDNPPLYLQRRWQLIVKANDEILLSKIISKDSAPNNRADVNIDISKYAGEEVNLELVNQQIKECDGTAYWYKIEIVSE